MTGVRSFAKRCFDVVEPVNNQRVCGADEFSLFTFSDPEKNLVHTNNTTDSAGRVRLPSVGNSEN